MTEGPSLAEVYVVGLFIATYFIFFQPSSRSKSRFRLREADRESMPKGEETKREEAPRLEGVRLTGAPHEILGVPKEAGKREINKAYRKLMKRYHPDRVAQPDTPEWNAAQEAASTITSARDEMIDQLKN